MLQPYLTLNQVVWNFAVSTITVMKFRDFLIIYQIFLSHQVKWSEIISKKHSIYELPHELLNNLSLEF